VIGKVFAIIPKAVMLGYFEQQEVGMQDGRLNGWMGSKPDWLNDIFSMESLHLDFEQLIDKAEGK
jgi:hypothetical protein